MRKQRIIVVDDEEFLVDVLKDYLELKNYYVLTAYNGREALNHLEKEIEDIQVIFSDINMPVMDGISLMENVRKKYKKVKIVLMTGYAARLDNLTEIKQMADGFIKKPFRLNKIDEILENI